MKLRDFANNLNRFVLNYDKVVNDFHDEQGADFIDLNTQAMDKGEDSEGDPTPEYRNPEYGGLKGAMGGNSKNWDFKFSGDLRSAMYIKDGLISSTDSKTSKLKQAVPNMFGVQKKLLKPHLKEQYIPNFVMLIKTNLFK